MRHRSWVRNRSEFLLAWVALKSLELLPTRAAHRLARGYVRLLDLTLPRLRQVARNNLQLALPELSPAAHEATIHGVFASLARVLVTLAKLPSIRADNLDKWIRFEGYEHFECARCAGKGVLFATAHLGNWELSAYAHALVAGPMQVVVRPLDNPMVDAMVERRRAFSGNQIISKRDPARAILRALARNEAVGILIDQNVADHSNAFVSFFGVPAAATTGFARLAASSGAAVIPGYALWSETEERYVLHFDPPVAMSGDAERDTQVLQSRLEAVIRAYPDQWLWIHRRWKTRPPGTNSLYETTPARHATL
jgi:KDO2-lipid IV(A) lauroyltransferase